MRCPQCLAENPENSRYCSDCGSQLLDQSEQNTLSLTKTLRLPIQKLPRGSIFADRYQVIEELGNGGMGRVYRVLDTNVDEEIALKLIRPDIAADKKTVGRFRKELALTRQIPHRNVCRMIDFGEVDGSCYITMEYVPGEDLKSFIRRSGKLTVAKTISVAKQVCEGLEEAHRLGVIHRDLKSNNIMIDRDGNARIMDFGLARSMKKKGTTRSGVMLGTPDYMAPEQVETADVDQRADVYSLGVIMYEMLTGKVPFDGDTPVTVAMKHRKEAPPDPNKFNPGIPGNLKRVVLRCLEKEKEQRFQNAKEVYAALDKIEKDVLTGEHHLTRGKSSPSITKTNISWKFYSLIFVLVAAIAAVGIGVTFFPKEAPVPVSHDKLLVVLPFENLGSPDDEYFADGITEEITSRLSAIQGVGVISRTSAKHYKESQMTPKQIGEELDVDFVIEGSVRWDRDALGKGRVRVTPRLIRVTDDTQLWSERYDRTIEDIFSVQAEIAEQVAKQLDINVLAPVRETLRAKPTANLEAYNLFLRARELIYMGWVHSDDQGFEKAIDQLNKAVALDPEFAPAYAQLSIIHSRQYFFGVDRTEQRLTDAKMAVDRALQLQPDLVDARIALAYYYYWGLMDHDQALQIFESVQKSQPNFSPELLGYIQRRQGKWEDAIATLENAFKLNPRYSQLAYEIGLCYLGLYRYDQAELWFDRSLAINPSRVDPVLGKTTISVLLNGDLSKAREVLKTAPSHKLTDYMWFTLGLFERNYQDVLDRLHALTYDSFEAQHHLFEKDLAYATVYYSMKDFPKMREHADAARITLERALGIRAGDPRFHSALSLAYAFLDRKQEAIREANRAVALCPVSKDAAFGPYYALNLAKVYAVVNEHEEAVEQLEYILTIPSCEFLWQLVTAPCLRFDPIWHSLRGLPRFEQILQEN
jgi:serine/threonine protein kinase/tetratricopeptide (TPR) repeat protein